MCQAASRGCRICNFHVERAPAEQEIDRVALLGLSRSQSNSKIQPRNDGTGKSESRDFSGTTTDSADLSNIDDGERGSLAPCAQLGARGSAGIDIKFSGILRRKEVTATSYTGHRNTRKTVASLHQQTNSK
jgi:hypothetical protein